MGTLSCLTSGRNVPGQGAFSSLRERGFGKDTSPR
jgi:hypothetical protein